MFYVNELITGLKNNGLAYKVVSTLPDNYKKLSFPYIFVDLITEDTVFFGDNVSKIKQRIYYLHLLFRNVDLPNIEKVNDLEKVFNKLNIAFEINYQSFDEQTNVWDRNYRIILKKFN